MQRISVLAGNDLVSGCTGDIIQTCAWGCTSGACNPPPALPPRSKRHRRSFTSAARPQSSGPAPTPPHAQCTAPTNSWTSISSTGRTSSPIQGQTIYTLHCIGVANSNPPTIDKQATVNIIPTFNEQ